MLTYYLVLFPGPVKMIVDRDTYENATRQDVNEISTPKGNFRITERYV
jgi:hypothetical protein